MRREALSVGAWRRFILEAPMLLRVLCLLLPAADSRGGIMQDERLQYSDGSWHRAQRDRVSFETACYFTHEEELPLGCQYRASQEPEWQDDQLRSRQLEALKIFYTSLKGHTWRSNENWNHGDPCWDFWFGITCDEHGHVIYIELADNRLSGTVPVDIGRITSLLKIDLASSEHVYMGHPNKDINRITGEFPSLKDVKRLAELEISGNLITALPADLDANANTLRSLSASRNRLIALPSNLRRFKFLHTLELDRNQILGSFPAEVGSMTNLRVLTLSYNELRGRMPEEITRLRNIEIFDVSHNQFLTGEIPESIIADWTENKFMSIMNTSLYGYVNSLCSDIPFCWRFMYDTHKDLTWATASDVPDIVNITMKLAIEFR
eukprot:TRINITY_DN74540_c0_g1_i1.p1 TRINITY_DN74540_c0_g1~~TRINITY_DN74540_c0_g1_i1.p1  ORF type:complete len:379 (-),score=83.18 TRINITY_DN74540_c0_g1_i1:13-1149(-)